MNSNLPKEVSVIKHADNADLTIAGHAVKSILDVKFSRAKERHASAMGFSSSNHLLAALKEAPIEKGFDEYIQVLKAEALQKHQVVLTDGLIEQLRRELCD
jgi:hypothetical protein